MPKPTITRFSSQIDTIARGLSETFSPFCEVVVGDLKKSLNMPFYPSIINLSGRQPGQPATELWPGENRIA